MALVDLPEDPRQRADVLAKYKALQGEAQTEAAKRELEIPAMLAVIRYHTDTLEKSLEELNKQLTPICHLIEEPAPKSSGVLERTTTTGLGQELANVASALAEMIKSVAYLRSRLEI